MDAAGRFPADFLAPLSASRRRPLGAPVQALAGALV